MNTKPMSTYLAASVLLYLAHFAAPAPLTRDGNEGPAETSNERVDGAAALSAERSIIASTRFEKKNRRQHAKDSAGASLCGDTLRSADRVRVTAQLRDASGPPGFDLHLLVPVFSKPFQRLP